MPYNSRVKKGSSSPFFTYYLFSLLNPSFLVELLRIPSPDRSIFLHIPSLVENTEYSFSRTEERSGVEA